ncbi:MULTISPECIES: pitrilysin family protein [unclassified Neisseria]|uniref:M16 family metallopeptidase n=1 Tax=unclassified Neisseria TaxID=2623750 RepID=UPI001072353E|nr:MULTISPECIES: pitrilysin family protein [unclassified Neisseria]MBF0803723.1 insulinase family protein [Neisseria sp. 19428wB4_WF04]TFU43551.1 insulinase family protein [Neisseria sp. WF04]
MLLKPAAALFAAILPLAVYAAVDIQRWYTPEGTQVLLVERHQNPIVDVQISFKGAGSAFSPEGKGEVAGFAAALLTGGTQRLDEEAFKEQADSLAAAISSDSSSEGTAVTLRSLSRPGKLKPALSLLNQALAQPRFDAAVFERIRKQSITALQQQETDPGFIAERALARLNYGSHPYGRPAQTSVDSIRRITLDDIRAFYRSRYGKNNAVVAVVGDIDRRQTEALVRQALNGLPAHSSQSGTVPAVPEHLPRQQNIPFAGEQAQIVMGMPLIKRNDPDYYALVAGNYILGGGGFDSRLMKELRDKHGYTYGASSSLEPSSEAGPLTIGFSTQKANTSAALAAARKVLADFSAEGPTEAELQQAKANITGSFPLRFDTNAKLLGYLSLIGFYNLPDDYLEAYPKAVSALTAGQVKSAWQRRVKAENMNIVVVGAEQGEAEAAAGYRPIKRR